MRIATLLVAYVLCSSVAFAGDESSINVDATFDFSKVATFAIRPGRINSQKPELNNRLFLQKIDAAIRAAVVAKGLKEVADRPDVFVDFSVASMDYSVTGGQRGTRTPDGPRGSGIRGTVIPGTGPIPELFTAGTLVIDMSVGQTGALVWRGTYRDEERSGPRLARKLPDDATDLVSKYPPRNR
jgi:hypothetical protein